MVLFSDASFKGPDNIFLLNQILWVLLNTEAAEFSRGGEEDSFHMVFVSLLRFGGSDGKKKVMSCISMHQSAFSNISSGIRKL